MVNDELVVGDEIIWNDPLGRQHRGVVLECKFLTMFLLVDELNMKSGETMGFNVKIPREWVESCVVDPSQKRSVIADYNRAMSII